MASDKFPTTRYSALAIIGSGAGGTVYRCIDKVLKKQVAIKTLNSLSPDKVVSFQNEARANSSLDHDSIIRVFDFGVTSGSTPYMVMELFAGTSLDRVLKEQKIGYREVAYIFERVANALAHAHKKGIFHRDVKCSNILISALGTSAPQVKLIDFGVAGFKSDRESAVVQGITLVGTPAYMPPDQALSRPYDVRSEIYSLGCSMFEALTGTPPFDAETALELINLHANQTPPRLAEKAPSEEFPEDLEEITAICLAKEPEDRFQTMEQFASAVSRLNAAPVQQDQPAEIIAASSFQKDESVSPDHKPLSPMIPLVVTCLVGIGLLVWIFSSQFLGSNQELPTISQTMHNERKPPILVPVEQAEITLFEKIKIGDRIWLKPKGRINDSDLIALEGRTDFQFLVLRKQGLTGVGFKHLTECTNLEGITLHGTTPSKEGMNALVKLKSLQELILDSSDVSDEDVKKLAALPNLRMLVLDDTPVSDDAIIALSGSLNNLTTLTLGNAQNINGNCLEAVSKMPKLDCLSLTRTSITAEKLKAIKSMPKLQALAIGKLNLTDAELAELLPLKPVSKLELVGNPLTDKSIATLARMPHLQRLQIGKCLFSKAGIARLQKLLPNCEIVN